MTREKYESLPLSTLKALAKSRNMKGISTLRKEALIERMLEEDQKENQNLGKRHRAPVPETAVCPPGRAQ